ncbi:MAG: sulfite exporter TauE/SafE family protein [bacterium]
MIFSPLMLAGGALLGFSMGILTGFFGAGGGFILTPVLNIFLGLPMNLAVGTSACQVLGASSFSLFHYIDRRWLGLKVALWMGSGIPFGVWFGSHLVKQLKAMGTMTVNGKSIPAVDFILLVAFAVFLGLITTWLLVDNFVLRRGREDESERPQGLLARLRIPPMVQFRTIHHGPFSGPVLIVLGLVVGCLSGLMGIGGGVVMIPMLFYLVGQEIKAATRTITMLIFITGLCSTIAHARAGNINWTLAACLIGGSFLGTRLGAWLQHRTTGKRLRQYFALVVLTATLMVTAKLLML